MVLFVTLASPFPLLRRHSMRTASCYSCGSTMHLVFLSAHSYDSGCDFRVGGIELGAGGDSGGEQNRTPGPGPSFNPRGQTNTIITTWEKHQEANCYDIGLRDRTAVVVVALGMEEGCEEEVASQAD